MKKIFISASKYREIAQTEGTEKALEALAQDLGSEGDLHLRPIFRPGAGQVFNAYFDDIDVVLEGTGAGGTLRGLGFTEEEARENLLTNLLTPEFSVPRMYDRTKARLGIRHPLDPSTIAVIEP